MCRHTNHIVQRTLIIDQRSHKTVQVFGRETHTYTLVVERRKITKKKMAHTLYNMVADSKNVARRIFFCFIRRQADQSC